MVVETGIHLVRKDFRIQLQPAVDVGVQEVVVEIVVSFSELPVRSFIAVVALLGRTAIDAWEGEDDDLGVVRPRIFWTSCFSLSP